MRLLPFFSDGWSGEESRRNGKKPLFCGADVEKEGKPWLDNQGVYLYDKEHISTDRGTESPYFPWKGGVKRWR